MNEIYFDNAATTRVDEDVVALMAQIMREEYGNPSSLHTRGVQAQLLVEHAKKQLLSALGAKNGEVLFTSGGTEANNLALFGAADAKKRRGNRIIITSIEHSSVLAAAHELARRNFEVVEISPESDGRISVEKLLDACNEDTILVSMMLVNNEVGTIQPVAEAAKKLRAKAPNALLHTDAVQAFGKIPFSVATLGVDMLSLSGHKIHAPKGVGALYLANKVRITPLLYGGSQQHGLRPGTESVPMITALGLAAKNAASALTENRASAQRIKDTLINGLAALPNVVINSPAENCSPFLLNCSIVGYRSETLLHFLASHGIYVSSGSACSKGAKSHVLAAMGKSTREIESALRLSLCKYNTPQEAERFCDVLSIAVHSLRQA
ncbi:MAG TPA: cysteine desulfurase family protein [Clostridia bacterium]|nr:cysteine desulfurase family protein [Clostridia bacterium]